MEQGKTHSVTLTKKEEGVLKMIEGGSQYYLPTVQHFFGKRAIKSLQKKELVQVHGNWILPAGQEFDVERAKADDEFVRRWPMIYRRT